MTFKTNRQITGLVVAASILATLSLATIAHAAQPVLTGLNVLSTNANGQITGSFWNTFGPDLTQNLYVNNAPLNTGAFLNDANAGVSVTLPVGRSDFYLSAEQDTERDFYGINVFLNGNQTNPAISLFAPIRTGSPTPAFSQITAQTLSLSGVTVAPGGSSWTDGAYTVTVADFFWLRSSVFGLDTVGPYSIGASSNADFLGKISLVVAETPTAAIPEPTTWALMILGFGGAGVAIRRRRAALAA